MKKIVAVMLSAFIISLSGCSKMNTASDYKPKLPENDEYTVGVWFSYSELDSMINGGNFKAEFESAIKKCKDTDISDAFVHTVPFCDAVYDSEYYPVRSGFSECGFDVLSFMTDICHKYGIRFHAWINPYRIKTSDCDTETLDKNSPAYIWLHDDVAENDTDVCVCNGVYFDPSSFNVRRLVMNTIREIITKYDVDGIHFDDYFYPTTDTAFDAVSYEKYASSCKQPLTVDNWRRANVNALISGCAQAIKFCDKDVVFSVSPSASIEKNYNNCYADVTAWCRSNCVDMIIPQLYFGFDYPDSSFKFGNLLNDWKSITADNDVRLVIGLASYKIGTDAQPDCDEWRGDDTVLSRQVEICKNDDGICGHCFFSYSSLFSPNEKNKTALQKIKSIK